MQGFSKFDLYLLDVIDFVVFAFLVPGDLSFVAAFDSAAAQSINLAMVVRLVENK